MCASSSETKDPDAVTFDPKYQNFQQLLQGNVIDGYKVGNAVNKDNWFVETYLYAKVSAQCLCICSAVGNKGCVVGME